MIEDTKRVSRSVGWTATKQPNEKGQTTIYKILHRKLKIEDTKRVSRSRRMDRQQNSQTKKDKRTNTTLKTKY